MKKMYSEKLEKEYKEIVKKTKKQYLGKAIILLFCLLFLLYIDKFILLVMIDLFLSFFFSVEYFGLNITYKNIYDYCTLKKKFPGKKMEISMDKFEEMLDEGIPANTYFLIDDTVLNIECNQKYYFVNFLLFYEQWGLLERVMKKGRGEKVLILCAVSDAKRY